MVMDCRRMVLLSDGFAWRKFVLEPVIKASRHDYVLQVSCSRNKRSVSP